jgi:hypothetical protein
VSAEFFKKLFSFLRVRPEFIDIVVLFGEKATPVEQAFSSFFSYCRPVANDGPTSDLGCGYGEQISFSFADKGRRGKKKKKQLIMAETPETLDITSNTRRHMAAVCETHFPSAKLEYTTATTHRPRRRNGSFYKRPKVCKTA